MLHPDDEDDPTVFRLDLDLGMSTVRVVFGRDAATGRPAIHATSEASLSFGPDAIEPTDRRRASDDDVDRPAELAGQADAVGQQAVAQDIGALVYLEARR